MRWLRPFFVIGHHPGFFFSVTFSYHFSLIIAVDAVVGLPLRLCILDVGDPRDQELQHDAGEDPQSARQTQLFQGPREQRRKDESADVRPEKRQSQRQRAPLFEPTTDADESRRVTGAEKRAQNDAVG